jgi:hypothetical protein
MLIFVWLFFFHQNKSSMKKTFTFLPILSVAFFLLFLLSCSKGGGETTPPPADPCAGKTIVVNATSTNATVGQTNGSIAVSATGSTGFTFSINGGSFLAVSAFNNLAAGTYTITAKDASGCTGTRSVTVAQTDPCLGRTIVVTPTPVATDKCTPTGSVSVSASGSTGFTFSFNGGAFQASNQFNGLAAGTFPVSARDVDGCVKTENVTITNKPDGPLFLAVRQVINANCGGGGNSCHLGNGTAGGLSFTADCNIVANRVRIKARAVDNNPSQMPPLPNPMLSAADKAKINDWIAAGGGASN